MKVSAFSFHLPPSLNAAMPPERRGIRRDYVRMMVLDRESGRMEHTAFHQLSAYVRPGDMLVMNASRTVPAVMTADLRTQGSASARTVEIRLARRLNEAMWEVLPVAASLSTGDTLVFSSLLHAEVTDTTRPPFATLVFSQTGTKLYDSIYALGEPIRYEYIQKKWELDYYQTVFATVPGSVEMPSAGRAFSWELLFKLRRQGIGTAYLQLHTGLSYLLDDNKPFDPSEHYEHYVIPEATATAITQTKQAGGRVIAVGTTVVRALESAARRDTALQAQSGWTNLHVERSFPLQIVDGLITGFHEPEASHLDLLSAFVEPSLLLDAYGEAIREQYLWHEFGDMNLII
ncbi:S-adenosylmethionine:tRNA ribosyltransferase-isomerase [Paenibacillus sp. J5C_2022]|uniref:S-adenosylmethionine:tRNA ribosyltransferase-isomerase n=1 Tax=Paenibacillus sp. J5C2022 TaxID=2977129 RepID=UPI0021CEDFF1|nr:S-adenosylmethionine:tRNA ribosyltransferase-isomerase [Paenibacillus sp. J5C2022]MCU6710000.1 S-adenosylmethionine:tRNA ribosyltransferase-isomerase [Paenibacillus sp. J5C2022]